MQITIDDIGNGARPLYDTNIGQVVMMAMPSGKQDVKCNESQLMVPLFPLTPNFFRSVAETIECAEKDGRWCGCLIVNTKESKAGFFSH